MKEQAKQLVHYARTKVVEAYSDERIKVASNYRGIALAKYEKMHPGRVKRRNLPVKQLICDGVMQDVVLLRKTPKDEWDIEAANIKGATTHIIYFCVYYI